MYKVLSIISIICLIILTFNHNSITTQANKPSISPSHNPSTPPSHNPSIPPSPSLQTALSKFYADPLVKSATLGFYAASISDGRVIVNENGEKSLIPASTLKTVTTATALSLLGADYRMETKLQYDGTIDANGVLQGNLYIKGGGDPTLGTQRKYIGTRYSDMLKIWTQAIKDAGITAISGQVIGDAGIFEESMASPKWLWEDLGNYYGAGPSGLSFHENQYEITFKSGKTGTTTEIIRVYPQVPSLNFINRVKAKGRGDSAYIFNSPYNNVCHIRGTIPPHRDGFTVKGVVPEPALFCAYALHDALNNSGISISEKPSTQRRQEINNVRSQQATTTIHTHYSPPLSEIAFWVNKRSINLYADHILKILAYEKTGRGTLLDGTQVITNFWESKGIDLTGFNMFDGSGLSPVNSITPQQLTQILRVFRNDPAFQVFHNTLPVCGDPGDVGFLKGFLNTPKTAQKFQAKSGYMSRNRGFAGYYTNTQGEQFAFTILLNNYACGNSAAKIRLQNLLTPLVDIQ